MSYRVIEVSEIAEYVYCRRSWWLRRRDGRQPENSDQLAAGLTYHQTHNRTVRRSNLARRFALVLIFIAFFVLAFWFIGIL